MVLILSDVKDEEMACMHALASGIMTEAVELWPTVRCLLIGPPLMESCITLLRRTALHCTAFLQIDDA